MVRVDIEIEDYLDEISTHSLISELASRKNTLSEFRRLGIDILNEISDEDLISYLKDNYTMERLLQKILGLREWHDKKRIIQEIESL